MGSRFITTYRKDYNKKRINFSIRERMQSEFKDPINESFRHYLKLGLDASATATPPVELGHDYLEKFNKLYPKLGKSFFKNSINKEVLERSFTMEGESVYQNDYCDKEKDLVYVEERRRKSELQLPSDWEVPLTTQTASYRNPAFVGGDVLPKTMPTRPKNHLSNNDEYPSAPYDELLRAAGMQGAAPCSEPVRLPGDPCRPNQKPIAFRLATMSKQGKGDAFGNSLRGGDCGKGIEAWNPFIKNGIEVDDNIKRWGQMIYRDTSHGHSSVSVPRSYIRKVV